MNKTGYILCSQDNTYRSEPIITSIAFSTNKSELEQELKILMKNHLANKDKLFYFVCKLGKEVSEEF